MKPLTISILAMLGTTLSLHAEQAIASPLSVQKVLQNLSDLGAPNTALPELKLEMRIPGNTANAPSVVHGDISVKLNDWGSGLQGIFQLNNANGGLRFWSWQNSTVGGAPHEHMRLDATGRLDLFGTPLDAGVFVNGSRLVSEASLASSWLPEIQAMTVQVGTALSLGDINGIIGSGSMAAGAGASVYGAGSLAFGEGAHVGTNFTVNPQGQPSFVGTTVAQAKNAVALGQNANARRDGAMAFGKGANAVTVQSIAIGQDSEASGGTSLWWDGTYAWGSIAVGTKAKATGTASSAFGLLASAMGSESIALGPRAVTWPGAPGSVAMGWNASANCAGSLALGNGSKSLSVGGICLGQGTFTTGPSSAAIGSYIEATGAGMIALGTAPSFTNLTVSANWEDLNSVVFIVGGGKPGVYTGNGGTGGWDLSDFDVTRRTSLSVTRGGDVKAAGKVEASKAGGIVVPDTIEAKDGLTRLRGKVIIDRQGDISMGTFVDGPQP